MSGTNCNNIVDTAVEATSSTNNHHQPSSSSSSSTFLASENLCGQTLLSLVGKGHSILANIRILSERVPCAFLAAASLDNKRENNGGIGKRGSSAARSSSTSSDGLFLNIFGQSSSTADQSRSKDDNQLTDDGTATTSSNRNDMRTSCQLQCLQKDRKGAACFAQIQARQHACHGYGNYDIDGGRTNM